MTDIYLDNNATTKVDPLVVNEMLPYFTEQFGNPSSIHKFADGVARALKKARQQVQELIGAEHDSEIIFTSCMKLPSNLLTESSGRNRAWRINRHAAEPQGNHHDRGRASGYPEPVRTSGKRRLHNSPPTGG